jgi:hypothetical protein
LITVPLLPQAQHTPHGGIDTEVNVVVTPEVTSSHCEKEEMKVRDNKPITKDMISLIFILVSF